MVPVALTHRVGADRERKSATQDAFYRGRSTATLGVSATMNGLLGNPLVAFLGLSLLSAVYVAALVWLGLRFFYSADTPSAWLVTQFLVWVVPGVLCAYAQLVVSRQGGVTRPRLWLQVAAAGFGAPVLGVGLVLFAYLVMFNGSM